MEPKTSTKVASQNSVETKNGSYFQLSLKLYLKDQSTVVGLVTGVADEGGSESLFNERERHVGVIAEEPPDEVAALVHRLDLDLNLALEDHLLDEDGGLVAVRLSLDLGSRWHGSRAPRAVDSGQKEGDDAGLAWDVKPESRPGSRKFDDSLEDKESK